MDKNKYSTKTPTGMYNDGAHCPVCKGPLEYEYYNMAHIGKFSCPDCGLATKEALCRVTGVDLDKKILEFDSKYKVQLSFASTYNAYNLLAAYTVAACLGYDRAKTAELLSGYLMKNGRVKTFDVGGHEFMLLTSKHENSVSYNQSIDYCVRSKTPFNVMFVVDSISRKYYTGETSWLYDINFDALEQSSCEKIVLSGRYAADLALRFSFTGIADKKILTIPDIAEATREFSGEPMHPKAKLFLITCFSDRDKVTRILTKK